jgi:hypothetical protein
VKDKMNMQEYMLQIKKRKDFDEELEYVSSNNLDLSETFDESTKLVWNF